MRDKVNDEARLVLMLESIANISNWRTNFNTFCLENGLFGTWKCQKVHFSAFGPGFAIS